MSNEKSTFKPVILKAVTLPLFKQVDDVPMFLALSGAIYTGKDVKQAAGTVKMEPAELVKCVNLETGEEGELIVNAVLKSTLEESYPSEAYVNKAFQITRKAKTNGKRYHTYSVFEIENPLTVSKTPAQKKSAA